MLELINLLEGGIATPSISNAYANEAVEKLQEIVKTLTNVIYAVLAVFLVVKGALIGMQIVKAADEPQVRQEKIGSLKWLVIGVAIAYAVTFAARILTNYLAGVFGTPGSN